MNSPVRTNGTIESFKDPLDGPPNSILGYIKADGDGRSFKYHRYSFEHWDGSMGSDLAPKVGQKVSFTGSYSGSTGTADEIKREPV
ncbi:hypothetical protein ACSSUR_18045 [Pseudomonas cedrina]|uniref:hypothetical protein n=1 Tax=Pseudomonas cedrina TaxID=651740 RepID=UPI003ED8547A